MVVSHQAGGKWLNLHIYRDSRGKQITLVGARKKFKKLPTANLRRWSKGGVRCPFLDSRVEGEKGRVIDHQEVEPPSPRNVKKVLVLSLRDVETINSRYGRPSDGQGKSPWMTAAECWDEYKLDRSALAYARASGDIRTKPWSQGHYLYWRPSVERFVGRIKPYPSYTDGAGTWTVVEATEGNYPFPSNLIYSWLADGKDCPYLSPRKQPDHRKHFTRCQGRFRGVRERMYVLEADLVEIGKAWNAGGAQAADKNRLPLDDARAEEGIPKPTLRGWVDREKLPSQVETRRRPNKNGGLTACRVRTVGRKRLKNALKDRAALVPKKYRDWPTQKEAAKQAGLSPSQLKRLRKAGRIYAVDLPGGCRYDPDGLDKCRKLREDPGSKPWTDPATKDEWYPLRYLHDLYGVSLVILRDWRLANPRWARQIERPGSGRPDGMLWVLHGPTVFRWIQDQQDGADSRPVANGVLGNGHAVAQRSAARDTAADGAAGSGAGQGQDREPIKPPPHGVRIEEVAPTVVEQLSQLLNPASKGGGTDPAEGHLHLHPTEYAVLQYLAKIYPQVSQISVIAEDISSARGLVGETVKNLESRTPPLVSRPKGERSGVGITTEGFKALRPEDRPTRLQPRG